MDKILLPNSLIFGGGTLKEITNLLDSLGKTKPFIITDNNMVELGIIKPLEIYLSESQIKYEIYKDTIPEPTSESILNAVDILKSGKFDSIIAFGGGSPIDSAKAISALASYGGKMSDYKFPYIFNKQAIPIIAIPTTAGTGSEVTKFTIITDEKTDEKMLCVGTGFLPAAAIVDYELSLTVPARTTADTGIDALTHAIEAYVSKKANFFSDTQALAAMKLIFPNLRLVFKNGNDKKAREKVMIGSTLAGMAFSNASVALVHGMSRPIGANYHVPHGLSNAMLLPTITQFSISGSPLRYSECAKAMGIAEANDNQNLANQKLIDALYMLNKDLNVPSPAEYGINKEDFIGKLDILSKQAIDSGSPANNPIVPSHNQIKDLYLKLWS